jgi:hypothetical protein
MDAKIKITMDGKGLSYWEDDIKLCYGKDKNDKGEFFDEACNVRGTTNPFCLVDMLIGNDLRREMKDGQYIEVICKVSDVKDFEENK